MADQTLTWTKTADILGNSESKELLQDIFADLHPGLIDENRNLASIFTPQSARHFLGQFTNFQELLDEDDSYEATVKKLQAQIDKAEAVRDDVLRQLFVELRPLEISYRQLRGFFENSKVPDGKVRQPVELHVLNADGKAIDDVYSATLASIEQFCRRRNDNFNFRDDICNLVIPGHPSQQVREYLETLSNTWGMLLITDTDDEKSFKNIERNFLPGGKYEYMKRPEDRSASDVVLTGYLMLRPGYWFEKQQQESDDLYAPPSITFAGALARADDQAGIVQGPVGSRFGQLAGVEKARIEPLIGEMEQLSMERQLIPVIRDADNRLCFFGCRTQADDPHGVLKFFTSYRILRFLERCCRHYLLQVAGQVLTREFMEEYIEKPLRRLLQEQIEEGTILNYELFVDKDSNKRMQGICDITLSVMPTGPAETFVLKIDVPEFTKPQAEKKEMSRQTT
ncbi:MAG TPA: hypothetical protein VHZ55_02875 [Bryobacteraceae bacterium]|jgi:hypothetical protein|nr:hypothetical protein [Bryobacteraceae bacterium]